VIGEPPVDRFAVVGQRESVNRSRQLNVCARCARLVRFPAVIYPGIHPIFRQTATPVNEYASGNQPDCRRHSLHQGSRRSRPSRRRGSPDEYAETSLLFDPADPFRLGIRS